MDTSVTAFPIRPDVVQVETTPRPTATPIRVHFSEILAGGARVLVRSAQAAVRTLPGAPLMAAALRGGAGNPLGGATGFSATPLGMPLGAGRLPEGPGGGGTGVGISAMAPAATLAGGAGDGGLESSLAQSQEMNIYYLQIQQAVNDQNRTFTALSNVLEVEHNTAKSAISNIH